MPKRITPSDVVLALIWMMAVVVLVHLELQ
jgi:hypothetical protein